MFLSLVAFGESSVLGGFGIDEKLATQIEMCADISVEKYAGTR